jgi:hypothetical protein
LRLLSRDFVPLVAVLSLGLAVPAARTSAAASRSFDDALGLYVIGGYQQERAWSAALKQPGVKGVALSEEWRTLEPQSGRRNWSALDEEIQLVARAGRKVGLRLQPGIATPEWVYGRGARRFPFQDRNPYHAPGGGPVTRPNETLGQSLTIPVPWDEPFLSAWEDFVAAAGKHYANETAIAMVHVTGPNKHFSEMHLPHEPEDRERWRSMGYSEDKLVGAWKRSIDAYARAFPQAALVLDLSPAVFDDKVPERVVDYAVDKYGRRVFLQNNILLGENQGRERVDWKILERYRNKTPIGFQRQLLRLGNQGQLTPARRRELRRDNFEKMLAEGTRLGGRYFEIGAQEARDFGDVVQRYGRQLER